MGTPHSAHRPPAAPPTAFGNVYPKGDIMAVVHDDATAQALVAALHTSGFPETDMDILEPAFVLTAAAKLARQGHPIVIIHAPDEATLQRARPVLAQHHVLKARHYGELTITEL